jgi:hypothetical protein
VSREILRDCLVFAARSHGTGPRRKGVWRWLGIGVLAVAVLALIAPASWAQDVSVAVQVSGTARPGATLNVAALVTINDGSVFQSIAWSQTAGATASISSPNASPTDVTLAAESVYKDQLIHVLKEPPITEAQLPPNVPVPEGEFVGGLQNRFQIVPANPFALEETGLVILKAEVTTTSGTYEGEAEIETEIPWKVKSEVRNVAIGIPVLLEGKDKEQDDLTPYDWALYRRPWGSTASLTDATSQYPEFTPDMRGEYVVTVTDTATGEMVQLEIYAGTWVGVITGQDENGRPEGGNCTPCHREAGRAPDIFPEWKETGHAEIFTDLLNTNSHYSDACFACHTVGYDLDVFNYGVDDSSFTNYQAFLDSGLLGEANPNAWDMVLADFPKVGRLANIQCENCHGPQSSLAHNQSGDPEPPLTGLRPRADISSSTCAVCHGEPLRHARFQQWQLSHHANYELAIDEGDSGNCSRCHTGNGFLTWLPILLGEAPGNPVDSLPASSIVWTEDTIHPQTCPVCHDPHQIGTQSGNDPIVTVRVSDETPVLVAGFKAPADLTAAGARSVGLGAMCMTCHNTRRGLRNDNADFDDPERAPHGGVQTDLLMGQNAYFVDLGAIVTGEDWPEGLPSPGHSNQGNLAVQEDRRLPDTCATCHMVKTPPPADLAYNEGGTNHTFFASETICSDCHDDGQLEAVQGPVSAKLATLHDEIAAAILEIITQQTAAGNSIDLDGEASITDVAQIAALEFSETHGRQAIIVTLAGQPVPLEAIRVSDVNVVDGLGAVRGTLYDFRCGGGTTDCKTLAEIPEADNNLPKAGWNYLLIHTDKSLGVHNYPFAVQVLDASIAALPPAPAPAGAAAASSSSSPSLKTAIEVNLGEIN